MNLSVISFSNELKLICLLKSIAIVSTQLNGYTYCYLTLIILFITNHLVSKQSSGYKYSDQNFDQFNITHAFAQSKGSKYFYISLTIQLNISSELTDKMKRSFFQAAVVSILLYECTTWTLTKRLEKKLDGN